MSVALDAARLSAAVYLPRAAFDIEAERLGYRLDRFWDQDDTQVALVRGHGRALLVFRGTSIAWGHAVSDLWSNLTRPWGLTWRSANGSRAAGRLHAGYAEALAAVAGQARDFAEGVASEIPLYVTGHSMGGALATLYAAWCDHKLRGCLSFGAPKAATAAAFQLHLLCPMLRFVVDKDWAPLWPPLIFSHPSAAVALASEARLTRRHWIEVYIDALRRPASRSQERLAE